MSDRSDDRPERASGPRDDGGGAGEGDGEAPVASGGNGGPEPGDRAGAADPDGEDRTDATRAGGRGDRDAEPGDLFDELEELEELVDSPAEREQVRETMRAAMAADRSGVFGRVVSGFDRSDAAEAFLGALLFGIPMFVEGGTQEIGAFIAARPAYFAATNGLAVGIVAAILYVADFQDVRVTNPLFGVIPRKFLGVVVISAATALFMMTVWGRVDWVEPWLAVCQVSVAWVPMAIGAALGDLLPG